jgi:hypothetical protein
MKKVVRLTESDLTRIVKKVISEQSEERKFMRALQKFLNVKFPQLKLVIDGRTGPNSQTEEAIKKYQISIGMNDVDGVWGSNTAEKMPPQDAKLLKKFVLQEGDILDKFLDWVGLG